MFSDDMKHNLLAVHAYIEKVYGICTQYIYRYYMLYVYDTSTCIIHAYIVHYQNIFSNTIFTTLHTVTVHEQAILTIEGMVCHVLVCLLRGGTLSTFSSFGRYRIYRRDDKLDKDSGV